MEVMAVAQDAPEQSSLSARAVSVKVYSLGQRPRYTPTHAMRTVGAKTVQAECHELARRVEAQPVSIKVAVGVTATGVATN